MLNEAIRNGPAVMQQMPRTSCRARWSAPAAAVSASPAAWRSAPSSPRPSRTHGAGGRRRQLLLLRPALDLGASRQYKLPILSIVLDNSGWAAVKAATLRVYPDGEATTAGAFHAELAPVEFSKIGEAFGAHAEKVSDPAAVPDAIARCAAEVRRGRSALLHARVTRL